MDKLAAWLSLKSAPGLRGRGLHELLSRYPDPREFVGEAAHPIQSDASLSPELRSHLAAGTPHPRFAQIAKLMGHYEIQTLCLGEEGYPVALANIVSPPLILYYRGDLPRALSQLSLAVVGTRKPTAYGRDMCAKLLSPACQRGVVIVSGLAYGIDTVAHQTAVRHHAPTLAVLASGVDTVYPQQNADLAREIIANGALVSEYEPGTKVDPWNFPARNRIISALAQAVFVVEGSLASGALLTAKFGLEQGREIMALPGEINHQNAQGPNYLIKSGAHCVTCPEDILSLLGLDAEVKDQMEILPEISPDEQQVYDLFREQQREISFDELLILTGHGIGKLSTITLNLELKGYLSKTSASSFRLA